MVLQILRNVNNESIIIIIIIIIIITIIIRKASKLVHEWKGYLEIFSRPQMIENSRQYLLLRTNISFGVPESKSQDL